MENIKKDVGYRIRNFRKNKHMTIEDLGNEINKSKSTVSKYESGDISIDIVTLCEIAKVLEVRIEELLKVDFTPIKKDSTYKPASFFKDSTRLYSYFYDGRSQKINRCVLDITPLSNNNSKYNVTIYMNIKNYDNYQICDHTYYGHIEHFDAITNIFAKHKHTEIEQITISILASFLDTNTQIGLMFGVSSKPLMPIALKMLFSKTIIHDDEELIKKLLINKDDFKKAKSYNMFTIY